MRILKKEPYGLIFDLLYATAYNFTGTPVYASPHCFFHKKAADHLIRVAQRAHHLGYTLKIFDAFRPTEAQWKLWESKPDPLFVADPNKGSAHSRGIAVDLTLVDTQTLQELDMGTPFDDFTPLSYHGNQEVSPTAQKNRLILLGLMTESGWDFYDKEWWHYQLFNAADYPLLSDKDAPKSMMS